MSERLMNNTRILKETRTKLPDGTSTAWDPGHVFQDRIDGTRFINEGDVNGDIFGAYPANRYELIERFEQRPAVNADIDQVYTTELARYANKNWEIVGGGAETSALCTYSAGGGVTITTAGTGDGDNMILTPHLDTDASSWAAVTWATDDRVIFETNIKTGAAITTAIIWAGLKLTNTPTVATDAEQAYVRYEDDVASGIFQLITSDNGTDTTTATGVTVAINTDYHIKLVINNDRDVSLFINGVREARVAAALGTAHDLIPYIGVETDGATTARAITCRGVRMSKDLND